MIHTKKKERNKTKTQFTCNRFDYSQRKYIELKVECYCTSRTSRNYNFKFRNLKNNYIVSVQTFTIKKKFNLNM